MKIKKSLICLIIISLSIMFIPSCLAEEGGWILSFKVEDLKTKKLILEKDFVTGNEKIYASIFAGAEYNITVVFNIAVTVPRSVLKISTSLERASFLDRFWELHSRDYPMVNYNPSDRVVRFNQVKGNFTISLYGKIPINITEKRFNGYVINKPVNYVVLDLIGPNDENLDSIALTVIDSKIDEYQNLLNSKENDLKYIKSQGVISSYIKLYEKMLNQSKAEAEQGFVDNAIKILKLLSIEGAPKEPSPSILEILFYPTVLILVGVIGFVGFMFQRNRGKLNYTLMVIEEQIKELEGLGVRLSKIDKSISSNLESIKERLKKLVGVV
jgi:hypothetical protein